MILNVLPLALGVYPGLASAATLFIDPCAQTDTSAPFIGQSGLRLGRWNKNCRCRCRQDAQFVVDARVFVHETYANRVSVSFLRFAVYRRVIFVSVLTKKEERERTRYRSRNTPPEHTSNRVVAFVRETFYERKPWVIQTTFDAVDVSRSTIEVLYGTPYTHVSRVSNFYDGQPISVFRSFPRTNASTNQFIFLIERL